MAKLTKRQKAHNQIDRTKVYKLEDAIEILKGAANSKFDQTLEISMNLGIDPRKSDQNVRSSVSLPCGTGKTVRVAVFARDKDAEAAKAAGADLVGAEDLLEEVKKGNINFDRCIATPAMVPLIAKEVSKVLGPRGLMPNPKTGTVTTDVATAVKVQKAGSVEFRAEKGGIVHAGLGKLSFKNNDLLANIRAFVDAVQKAKPQTSKGVYLRKISLSSTMGPGLVIEVASIAGN